MRRSLLLVAAFTAAFSIAASVSARELVVGLSADLTGVDPHWHNHGQNNSIAMHSFDTLMVIDAKGNLGPGLATSWKALSPTKHEIKLRSGVKFHDGTPLTAKDVVASFERVIKGVPNTPGAFTTFTAGQRYLEDMALDFKRGVVFPARALFGERHDALAKARNRQQALGDQLAQPLDRHRVFEHESAVHRAVASSALPGWSAHGRSYPFGYGRSAGFK